MDAARVALAEENAALKAALTTAQTKGLEVAAELAVARAKASEDMALIAQQKLRIAKLERQVLWAAVGTLSAPDRSTGRSASKIWKPALRKTSWRRKRPSPGRPRSPDLRASVPSAIHSPTTFLASAW